MKTKVNSLKTAEEGKCKMRARNQDGDSRQKEKCPKEGKEDPKRKQRKCHAALA